MRRLRELYDAQNPAAGASLLVEAVDCKRSLAHSHLVVGLAQ